MRRLIGMVIATTAVSLPLQRAEGPQPVEEVFETTRVGCYREGRFLNFDAAQCDQVGGIIRPLGPTEEEKPKPRPTLGVSARPLTE